MFGLMCLGFVLLCEKADMYLQKPSPSTAERFGYYVAAEKKNRQEIADGVKRGNWTRNSYKDPRIEEIMRLEEERHRLHTAGIEQTELHS